MKPQTSFNTPAIATKTPVYHSSINTDNMFGSWSTSDTSNQFQRPLLPPANSNFSTLANGSTNYMQKNNTIQFQKPLLAPVNSNFTTPGNSTTNYRNNSTSSSSSILSKEDILEFLK